MRLTGQACIAVLCVAGSGLLWGCSPQETPAASSAPSRTSGSYSTPGTASNPSAYTAPGTSGAPNPYVTPGTSGSTNAPASGAKAPDPYRTPGT